MYRQKLSALHDLLEILSTHVEAWAKQDHFEY